MSDELFPLEAVQMDSPKLAWMKREGVITWYHPGFGDECPPTWFAGFQEWWPDLKEANFFAEETAHNGDSRCVEGDTEADAICALAKRYEIKLWNEETQ
jgi:hypothetical protein